MRSGKLNLVVHQIVVDLRADKDGACHVKLHSAPEMAHKVIAADEIGKASELVARQKRRIETDALHADPRLQVQLRPLPQRGTINSAEIIKKWPERLNSLVQVLAGAESCVKTETNVMVKEEVQTETGEGTSADGGYNGVGGRPRHSGNAKTQIKLLCLRRASQQKKQAK